MKKIQAVTAMAAMVMATAVWAGTTTSTDQNDVILNGYDAVAYFTEGKPVKGSEKYTAAHGGAIYRFASAANRDLFRKSPTKYAPVYGGYCAYGAAVGKKFAVDGKAFEVLNGTLYVNKNKDVYETWSKDKPGNIDKADANWPRIRDKKAEDL